MWVKLNYYIYSNEYKKCLLIYVTNYLVSVLLNIYVIVVIIMFI